jgi:hypothetical protein
VAGGKMNCENCNKDISIVGAQMCKICDPDIMKIITRQAERISPNLCSGCREVHMQEHYESHRKTFSIPGERMLEFIEWMTEHDKVCRLRDAVVDLTLVKTSKYVFTFRSSRGGDIICLYCDCGVQYSKKEEEKSVA